jgi:hypothetical protein
MIELIKKEVDKVKKEGGKVTSIKILQNYGDLQIGDIIEVPEYRAVQLAAVRIGERTN